MRVFLLFFPSLLVSFSMAGAQTYKWIDENGVVSYSQIPPPGHDAETLDAAPQTYGDSKQANTELKALQQKLEDIREDRKLAKETEAKKREKEQTKQQNCTAARNNLRNLEALGRRLLKTSDGEYVRLTEDERQKRIKETEEQIRINCTRQ
jgi:Skp family chaperone for outer membrane proteins